MKIPSKILRRLRRLQARKKLRKEVVEATPDYETNYGDADAFLEAEAPKYEVQDDLAEYFLAIVE
jgi:hypothetical protein